MASASLRGLQPWLRPHAVELLRLAGARVQLTSVKRSLTQQRKLWRRFIAGQSRFPAAPPGTSMHEKGRAFDIIGPDDVLAQLGAIWESWGGRWGGRFHDPIHFEA